MTDGDQEATNGEQEPTDREQEPISGNQEPTDGDHEAPNGSKEPTHGEQEPTDGDQVPTDQQRPGTFNRAQLQVFLICILCNKQKRRSRWVLTVTDNCEGFRKSRVFNWARPGGQDRGGVPETHTPTGSISWDPMASPLGCQGLRPIHGPLVGYFQDN